MARIAGVDLPRDKAILYALPLLYGIGRRNAAEIIEKAGIDPRKKVKDLSEAEVGHLREIIDDGFQVEGDLRRDVHTNIRRLIEIGCYRGTPAPSRSSDPGAADAEQCTNPKGQGQDRGRKEEGEEVTHGTKANFTRKTKREAPSGCGLRPHSRQLQQYDRNHHRSSGEHALRRQRGQRELQR